MKSIIFLILCCCCIETFSQYKITQYRDTKGINSLEIDADTLYLSTRGGLVKMNIDGTLISQFNTGNSGLCSNSINFTKLDQNKNPWISIGWGNSYILQEKAGSEWNNFNNCIDPVAEVNNCCYDWMTDMVTDAMGNLWFTTTAGISKFNGSTWTFYSSFNNSVITENGFSSITTNSSGNVIYFGSLNVHYGSFGEGIYSFDGNNWINYNTSNSNLPSNNIITCFTDSKGNIWFAHQGEGKISKISADHTTGPLFENFADGIFPGNTVNDITEDKLGNIWFANNGGITKYDGINFTPFTPVDMFGIKAVSIVFDKNNTIWVGTDNGLINYDYFTWSDNFVSNNSLTSIGGIGDMEIDKNDILWYNDSGCIINFDGIRWMKSSNDNWKNGVYNDYNNNMYSIVPWTEVIKYNGFFWNTYYKNSIITNSTVIGGIDYTDHLWLIEQEGVYEYNGITTRTYNTGNSGLLENKPKCIAIDFDNNKWFGFSLGVVKYNGSGWTVYTTATCSINNNNIRDIAVDKMNNIWVVTEAGLSMFNGNDWTNYTTPFQGNTIFADTPGNIYFAADDGPTAQFDGTNWRIIPGKYYDLEVDSHYNIWRKTANEIVKMTPCSPTPDFVVSQFCNNENYIFTNTSGDIDPLSTFEWDINNDGTIESTSKDFHYSFPSAGIYNVRLKSTNFDTLSTEIIKAITVYVKPLKFDLMGSNNCILSEGLSVTLTESEQNVKYRLNKNGVPYGTVRSGSGDTIKWINLPEGTYSVLATHSITGCSNNMNNSVLLEELPKPNPFNLNGGGKYCNGSNGLQLVLDGTESYATYQLFNNNLPVSTIKSGTGSSIKWENLSAGIYYVNATNQSGCTTRMNDTVTIEEREKHTAFNLAGDGEYCQNGNKLPITLSGSESGIIYQLKNSESNVGSGLIGDGNPLLWQNSGAGSYTVIASYSSVPACQQTMTGLVSITENKSPVMYDLSPGGNYCTNTNGMSVTLSGSEPGINYNLIKDSTFESIIVGTGNSIEWNNLTEGKYSVFAVNDKNCTREMNGSAEISSVHPPSEYFLSSSNNEYCANSEGVEIYLSNSDPDITYQLFRDNSSWGSKINGTGSVIKWSSIKAGRYMITASNEICSVPMNNILNISEKNLPVAYDVIGNGVFCDSSDVIDIILSNSDIGVNYELINNGIEQDLFIKGDGNPLTWPTSLKGIFTILAFDSSGCSSEMKNSFIISSIEPYTIIGDTSYCSGENGNILTLDGSQIGVSYQLKKNNVDDGEPINGNGNVLTWENKTEAIYTIEGTAVIGCSKSMIGSIEIVAYNKPLVFELQKRETICDGGTCIEIILSGSEKDNMYQMLNNTMGYRIPLLGNDSLLTWNNLPPGNYSIYASNPVTGCSQYMEGEIEINVGNNNLLSNNNNSFMKIFPNPNFGNFTFHISEINTGKLNIIIYDNIGRKLKVFEYLKPEKELMQNISTELRKGFYWMQAIVNNQNIFYAPFLIY